MAFTPVAEPTAPAAPAAPATDTTRLGTVGNDFFDITTSQRVRIETRGGSDFVRLGTGDGTLEISLFLLGAGGGEGIQGRGARTFGRLELGDGGDSVFGTFAAGSSLTVLAGDGGDSIQSDRGNHYIDGGAGNDFLTGGTDGDTILGGDDADNITGDAAANFDLLSPGGNDLLFGDGGDDTIWGGAGDDRVAGGDGNDFLRGSFGHDTAWGGEGNDAINGEDGDDMLDGGGGRDTLRGGAGQDTLFGQAGDDQLFGDDGDDLLVADSGNDQLFGGNGNDRLRGGPGNNRLEGGTGADLLLGFEGDDFVIGGDQNDTLDGGSGNDTMSGGNGADYLVGGDGTDFLGGDDGDDTLDGGDGNDSIEGSNGADILNAGAGNDTLRGGDGNDTLFAGAGTDLLFGDIGDDVLVDDAVGMATLLGGAGNDVYIVTNAKTLVLDFEGGNDTVYVFADGWVNSSDIENVVLMNGADMPSSAILVLHSTFFRQAPGATTTYNYIFVESPFATSRSGGGLFAGLNLPANESLRMIALDADFRAAFRKAADVYERIANVKFVEVSDISQSDIAIGSHNMLPSGYANSSSPGDNSIDVLMINSLGNTNILLQSPSLLIHELGHVLGMKHPFDGNFVLDGGDDDNGRYSQMSFGRGKSNDGLMIYDIEAVRYIFGTRQTATGDDVYRFDRINNWFSGLVDDGGSDTIDLSGNQAGATLNLVAGRFSSINIDQANQTFFSDNLAIANGTLIENAIGTNFADVISGNDAANRIDALAGNDTLSGGAGNDTLDGGSGDDVVMGEAGSDALLSGSGNDTLLGGDGNDGLFFGAFFDAADTANGGAGTLDQVGLQGDYSAGVTLGANSAIGVEQFVLLPGSDTRFGAPGTESFSYNIITGNAAIAAGQQLIFQANTLRAGESFTLDASGELDGLVFTYAGQGTDTITGSQTGDAFFFGTGRFNAGDVVNGQGGVDQIGLQGSYSGASAIVFGAGQILNVEVIVLLTNTDTRFGTGTGTPFSYDLTTDNGNVAAGQRLAIQANTLASNEVLRFNGSAETDGSFSIFSGNGNDVITGSRNGDTISGRGGADTLTGGGGNDLFLYTNITDSTAAARDMITDFATGDRIDLSRIDAITGGTDDGFTLIGAAAFSNVAGQLRVNSLGGGIFAVEGDTNGDGAADFSIRLTNIDAHTITAADFVL
ncbi:MAG: M10 family metallopeptidase C-terminal domain-containing protein [Polymorphobacter sp.]